ncbi:MAG: hypothetical protein ACP5J5_05770 [Dissulfurimicrobium sp.]|uniref:hypothetical protein n=1 Tax=Dissulfurimicrobium TaxID=1769732 RepID=UPI001EDAEADD|nr:hypothetical protein [Dissulfurimicrobium hydrothermale]UKL13540.1 hypothetical protein LGS26_08720 [Dissulfurimicrobium hydrothermale]
MSIRLVAMQICPAGFRYTSICGARDLVVPKELKTGWGVHEFSKNTRAKTERDIGWLDFFRRG